MNVTPDAVSDLYAMQARALALRARYDEIGTARHGRPWTTEETLLGFVGDVGDLAKLAQGRAGVRPRPDLQGALAHELADCLWSVLVLADAYDVDLPAAFARTMDDLSDRLDGSPPTRDEDSPGTRTV